MHFFLSWKTANGQKKKVGMQTGAAASSHDFSRFKENREWNKASEETAAASNVGNYMEELQPKPQLTMSLESQELCTLYLPWLFSILDKCTLQPSSAELPFVLHLLFRSTATKNCPGSPQRQLQGSAGWSDSLVNVCQYSEGTGDVTSKGTSGVFCSGLHEVTVKEEADSGDWQVLDW